MTQKYKRIHIWNFPPTRTFIYLKREFRKELFSLIKDKLRTKDLIKLLKEKSLNYGITRKYKEYHLHTWRSGYKREKGRIKKICIPLWVLIEMSKLLSNSNLINNKIMRRIERNILFYKGWGKSTPIVNPKLPILFTPEMVSVFFHLCGDGHVGSGRDTSHYRQTSQQALYNFLKKLQNVFGKFRVSIVEESKLFIPRIITDFYKHFFQINSFGWNKARIPKKIKNLPKEFLIAGLTAFIVDEGCVGDFIEIYSKNRQLLNDILEITLKLGYKVSTIKKKYRYGKFDTYRFIISSKSLISLFKDIKHVEKRFQTCNILHKSAQLEWIVKVKNRKWERRSFGKTKELILKFLRSSKMTAPELALKTTIRISSIREHLLQLEKMGLIKRVGKNGRAILWSFNYEI